MLIDQSLVNGLEVMLLYVLESSGSSPGRQGFFMAINSKGAMAGSIGGGMMEHKFVEMAKEKLLSDTGEKLATDIRKQVHDKSAARNQSGMICSGEQTIWLYRLKKKDNLTVQRIIASLKQNRNGTLILSPAGIQFRNNVLKTDFEFHFRSDRNWLYKEKTGYKNQLFVIGGGHCALSFSRLMRSMDFFIRVYDDRKELKTMLENEAAHEKHFVSDYSLLKKMIPPGNNHYVVIMTFGYRTDDDALRALLGKDFKYLGLLGSKTKIKKMFAGYKKEGVPPGELKKIHTPVGLTIKSQTPEEIAVSIAAEIIKIKNEYL